MPIHGWANHAQACTLDIIIIIIMNTPNLGSDAKTRHVDILHNIMYINCDGAIHEDDEMLLMAY